MKLCNVCWLYYKFTTSPLVGWQSSNSFGSGSPTFFQLQEISVDSLARLWRECSCHQNLSRDLILLNIELVLNWFRINSMIYSNHTPDTGACIIWENSTKQIKKVWYWTLILSKKLCRIDISIEVTLKGVRLLCLRDLTLCRKNI